MGLRGLGSAAALALVPALFAGLFALGASPLGATPCPLAAAGTSPLSAAWHPRPAAPRRPDALAVTPPGQETLS